MYTNETKDSFIQLRAQGRSLADIAKTLEVSKRTLIDWNREFREQIRQLRAVELEALYEKILVSREHELKWMVQFEQGMADLMLKRGFRWMKDRDLLRYILEYRREIRRIQAEMLAPLDQAPASTAPATHTALASPNPAPNGNGAPASRSDPFSGV